MHIIYVEGDTGANLAAKHLLEQMQEVKQVLSFYDSLQALVYIKERYRTASARKTENPELVLLDIDKPGFGGFEILYILKGLQSEGHISLTNVYFMITTSQPTDKLNLLLGKYTNMLGIFKKPYNRENLEALILKGITK